MARALSRVTKEREELRTRLRQSETQLEMERDDRDVLEARLEETEVWGLEQQARAEEAETREQHQLRRALVAEDELRRRWPEFGGPAFAPPKPQAPDRAAGAASGPVTRSQIRRATAQLKQSPELQKSPSVPPPPPACAAADALMLAAADRSSSPATQGRGQEPQAEEDLATRSPFRPQASPTAAGLNPGVPPLGPSQEEDSDSLLLYTTDLLLAPFSPQNFLPPCPFLSWLELMESSPH